MKKIIFLIIAFAFSYSYGQNFEIINGPQYKVEPWTTFDEVFGSDENGIYVKRMIYKNMWGYGIQKIDKNTLQQVYYIEIADKWAHWGAGDNKDFILYLNGNKIVLITYGEFELKFREYDCYTGKKLSEATTFWKYGTSSTEKYEYHLDAFFSPDRSKLSIFKRQTVKKENNKEEKFYSVAVFDAKTLTRIAEKNFPNSFEESTIGDLQYYIDNSGDVFLNFNYMSDFNNKAIGTAVSKFDISNQQITTVKLDTENKFIKNSGIRLFNKNLTLSGQFLDTLYRNDMQKKKPGFYFILIDPENMSIKNKVFTYYTDNINTKFTYRAKYENEDARNKYLEFSDLIKIDDSYFLIENHTYNFQYTDYNSSVFSYESTIDKELLISKFDKNGNFLWTTLLPKSTRSLTSRYNYYVKNNKLLIFHQDSPKNGKDPNKYDGKEYYQVVNGRGCAFVCTTVNDDGTLSKNTVFEQNKKFWYSPSHNVLSKNSDGLLIRMQDGKNERYDYIKIK